MHVFGTELKSIGQILLVGLILGAGLPLVFSAGIRAMAWGTGGDAEASGAGQAAARPHPLAVPQRGGHSRRAAATPCAA